ncbi:MAG: ABC transporter ATP-binding protein [Pseudomonadales bacterium]|nr:ABC transporter ATP-binding protein [Pseudomonadales bacterium]MBO6563123.1 ABC transporter ATP-binding protein [Pseudomonadales bacterium]MBO6596929.1 ABC transporter ATP-binding protein [Pseudomonadales bacterium]MBO6823082.1 ABC transporter ATP-binding protein [Pseudomonadales bacterium]
MLEIQNLSVDYGSTRIVDQLNLSLSSDEILMLVGPTGCGKTTILNAIAGLIPIAGGSIEVGDWRASTDAEVPPEKRKVGMVFQDFALFPHLSVLENVAFRLRDPSLAEHWLELLGLSGLGSAKPARLSGGQKQRVSLARALAHKPDLMLLDEPLSNLDAALKESLRWDIRDALKTAGIPAVWVTHDQAEALSVGDRLGVLDKGRLVQLDTPHNCYLHPADRFTAGFLGLASFVPGEREGELVSSSLGTVSASNSNVPKNQVDVLVRPEDLLILVDGSETNSEVQAAHFEGGSWLYRVKTDQGIELQIRTHQRTRAAPGQRVKVVLSTHDEYPLFERDQ